MNPATYVLTYRADADGHRRRNLDAVLAWLVPQARIDVILVEQDTTPTLTSRLPHPRCRVAFAYNPEPFNKSWGLNIGFRLAQTPWIGFGDADVIVADALWPCFELLGQGMLAAKPYRRLVDLDEEESQRVRAGDFAYAPVRASHAAPNREAIGERIVFAGGSVVLRRDVFAALGGWDERFRGWGGEDDALSHRIERSRIACTELDTTAALHLWHPRPAEATFGQPHYPDNRRLLEDYARCSDTQLQRMAEVQMQIAGHSEKYRPWSA